MSHNATSIASLCRASTPGTACGNQLLGTSDARAPKVPDDDLSCSRTAASSSLPLQPVVDATAVGAHTGAGTERDAHPGPRQRWVFRPSSPLS